MIEQITNKNTAIFNYYPPKNKYIGVVSIPHSGEDLPEQFQSFLHKDIKHLMQDVDYRVHELVDIEALQNAGIAVIKSNIIRVAIDLNRSRETTLLNWKKNSKGVQIVLDSPSEEKASELVASFYDPYYEMIKTMINELDRLYGKSYFVDLHSMPGVAEEYHLKINPNQDKYRPDFCISDQTGKTCSKDFIEYIQKELSLGYNKVFLNNPYFGGHITQHVDKHFSKTENIQIEINRSIYMNEDTKELDQKKIEKLKPLLTQSLINLFNQFS